MTELNSSLVSLKKLPRDIRRIHLCARAVLVLLTTASLPGILHAQFTPALASPIKVGSFPDSIATGDFNGDGKKDIVASNSAANSVSVLLGNGAGGFAAAPGSPFTVGAGPDSVAVGDFNGDGKLDIVTANATANNISLLLGNGSGGFTAAPGSPFAVGAGPAVLTVADFNGDGRLDIATANSTGNNVTVLLGNGTGDFTAAAGSPFAVGADPQFMSAGDFNGDGFPDLITADFNAGTVSLLLGDGAGGFTKASASPFAVGSGPNGMAVGDFNGDGRLDLATPNLNSNNVTVLLGDGAGGFAAAPGSPFATGNGPTSAIVGDFNWDGKLDIATTNFTGNNLTVLLGNGAGGFTVDPGSPYGAGTGPTKMLTADFNGDGKPDLANTNGISGDVTVLLNSYPTVTTPVIAPGGAGPVYSSSSTIQPGSWMSIYGLNLASGTVLWNNDFPLSLAGTSVTIGGKPAYLWFVSNTQINLQVPDGVSAGLVNLIVTTGKGTFTSQVTVAAAGPSFSLLGDGKHAAGVILTPNGGGAYGGGTYDLVGPAGAFAFNTRPAKAGETILLFGVGFGPTNPPVSAGALYSGAAATVTPVTVTIGGVPADVAFGGIIGAGLFQFNVTVPKTVSGENAIQAVAGGARAQLGPVITIQ